MNLDLNGKVALITGGANGIGEAIVRSFAAEGAITVIADRDTGRAQALVDDITAGGSASSCIGVDLTDDERVAYCVDETIRNHGALDILVNNAAVNDAVGLSAGSDAFRASLEANLVQVYAITHHALPHLRRAQGTVVNIGSKVADTGQGGTSGYAASKGGVRALTREWAVELAGDFVRVNAVIPAEVWTPMYASWLADHTDSKEAAERARSEIGRMIPLGRRMTTVEEIADTVVFLASPRCGHTTGQIVYVDGGYTHLDRAYTAVRDM